MIFSFFKKPNSIEAYCYLLLLSAFSVSINANVLDSDSDGINNNIDNCTLVANPDQRDSNNDGYGNRCDGDLNPNGIIDWEDVNRTYWYFGAKGDGNYNADADIDGDGIVNETDVNLIYSRMVSIGSPGPSAGP